jgi:hypothetical protein
MHPRKFFSKILVLVLEIAVLEHFWRIYNQGSLGVKKESTVL